MHRVDPAGAACLTCGRIAFSRSARANWRKFISAKRVGATGFGLRVIHRNSSFSLLISPLTGFLCVGADGASCVSRRAKPRGDRFRLVWYYSDIVVEMAQINAGRLGFNLS